MKRQLLITTLVLAAIGGVAVADTDSLRSTDGVAAESTSLLTGLGGFTVDVSSDVQTYDTGPGVIVQFEAGEYDSLQAWANESGDRRVIDRVGDRRAVLVAPVSSLGVTRPSLDFANLANRPWVTAIEPEFRTEYVDPVRSLDPASERTTPTRDVSVPGAWDAEGVAYRSDAPRNDPGDVGRALDADEVTYNASDVTVGYCDTGYNHVSSLINESRIAGAYDFVSDRPATAANNFENVSTSNLHGPWVASAIGANTSAAETSAMTPEVNVLVGRTLAEDGSGSSADITDCIHWMEANGADVLSLSLGSPLYSESMAAALRDYSAGNGTVALVAAGNSRMSPVREQRYVNSPADTPIEGTVTVGATSYANNASAMETAYFSSVAPDGASLYDGGTTAGQEVDVGMVGMNATVQVATESGTLKNHTLSGTSMATPYVASVAAAGLAANPGLVNDTDATRDWLVNASEPVPSAGTTEVGAGVPQVDRLVNQNASDRSQATVQSEAATARDAANRGYSGGGFVDRLTNSLSELTG